LIRVGKCWNLLSQHKAWTKGYVWSEEYLFPSRKKKRCVWPFSYSHNGFCS